MVLLSRRYVGCVYIYAVRDLEIAAARLSMPGVTLLIRMSPDTLIKTRPASSFRDDSGATSPTLCPPVAVLQLVLVLVRLVAASAAG